ncbi:MAG: fluoride efflux transporter CrcB [Planctomycetota bacterium]|jgi:CrcB protein
MRELLIVAAGGAVGAVARYSLSGWVYDLAGTRLPWGTLAVNVVGCFLIGIVLHASFTTTLVPPGWRLAIATGFLGSMTTFSTFSYETIRELERGSWGAAGANVLLNLAVGLPATWMGLVLARRMWGGA